MIIAFLSNILQSENAGTDMFIVFIYKCSCAIIIYWPIFKISKVLHMARKQDYDKV